MNPLFRFLLVSFLIWLIPFVTSFPFFSRDGQLTVNFWVFKTLMVLVLCLSAWFLLGWFYRSAALPGQHWLVFVLIGAGVMLVSIVLDMFTVIPFNRMTAGRYIVEVAVVYLSLIPISVYHGLRSS